MYSTIKLQDGPIKEVGVNGDQIEDLVEYCWRTLKSFNTAPHACRENSIALTKLEEAHMWLLRRKRDRELRGVEGTSAP